MRKIGVFGLLSVILVMIFTGCSKNGIGILPKSPEISGGFEAEMKIQAGDLEFCGTVKRYGMELWKMSVTEPETLAGLEIAYSTDGVKANLGELVLDVAAEDVRDKAAFALLFKAVDSAASKGKLDCEETENGLVYTSEFTGYTYTFTFDPETLAPVLLEIPEADFCAEFVSCNALRENADLEDATQTTAETD